MFFTSMKRISAMNRLANEAAEKHLAWSLDSASLFWSVLFRKMFLLQYLEDACTTHSPCHRFASSQYFVFVLLCFDSNAMRFFVCVFRILFFVCSFRLTSGTLWRSRRNAFAPALRTERIWLWKFPCRIVVLSIFHLCVLLPYVSMHFGHFSIGLHQNVRSTHINSILKRNMFHLSKVSMP